MILHSEVFNKAKPDVLRHGRLFRSVIMTALPHEKDDESERRNMYVSAALITPWSWLKEPGVSRHDSRFGIVDRQLKDGGSAGAAFNKMRGLKCCQNRLALCEVPAKMVPLAIRKMVAGEHERWRIELYSLGGLGKQTMRFGQYGVFVEFVPASHFLPRRVSLGIRSAWRLAGKDGEYVHRLSSGRDTSKKLLWHRLAFWAGQVKAGLLLPVLVAVLLAGRRRATL